MTKKKIAKKAPTKRVAASKREPIMWDRLRTVATAQGLDWSERDGRWIPAAQCGRRRAELRGSGPGVVNVVERIEDARSLVVWLEDGTEIHIELWERIPNMLDIRSNPDAIVVCPATSNRILVGRRPS